MKKALLLYSGGLDSRLAAEILRKQEIDTEKAHFKLPFGCRHDTTDKKKKKIFDVTKEPLLKEYLEAMKKARHGRGAGYNACKDCKIFIYKKAKEYAKEKGIKIIATGEVLGQRPMSQTKKMMRTIDENTDFEILRPLSAKRLEETGYEKKGLVKREDLLDLSGRSRKAQMNLAKEYNIDYPSPGGGCLLCEKHLKYRFKTLIEKELINEETLPLSIIARHFIKDDNWFVVSRNEKESDIIDKFSEENVLKGSRGRPSVYFQGIKNKNRTKEAKDFALELQEVYSKGKTKDERNKLKDFLI